MNIIRFSANDTLYMKKKHPCGKDSFTVIRAGSDVRLRCDGCGRDLTLQREAVEKMIRRVAVKEQ